MSQIAVWTCSRSNYHANTSTPKTSAVFCATLRDCRNLAAHGEDRDYLEYNTRRCTLTVLTSLLKSASIS